MGNDSKILVGLLDAANLDCFRAVLLEVLGQRRKKSVAEAVFDTPRSATGFRLARLE
jgi:hypothetical protein